MTPIEKVARAIRESLGVGWPYTGHDELMDEARAAIEALREPSDAMCEAGSSQSQRGGFEPKDTWRLMVDAALAEGPK